MLVYMDMIEIMKIMVVMGIVYANVPILYYFHITFQNSF